MKKNVIESGIGLILYASHNFGNIHCFCFFPTMHLQEGKDKRFLLRMLQEAIKKRNKRLGIGVPNNNMASNNGNLLRTPSPVSSPTQRRQPSPRLADRRQSPSPHRSPHMSPRLSPRQGRHSPRLSPRHSPLPGRHHQVGPSWDQFQR